MNTGELNQLCAMVRNKCKITWHDGDTDDRVRTIAEDAVVVMAHMLGMSGPSQDAFLKPGAARSLYENYCLYAWNNMTAEFEKNYKREILAERHKNEVAQREKD